MRLSIAMIVKNEEKNLDRTLKALEGIKDKIELEIVIVDTGSTDRTIEIARRYTDKVFEHEWSGNFAEMRNISLKYCTGEWILVLDADEELTSAEAVFKFFESEKSELFNSATVNIKNYDGNTKKTSTEAALVRLFRNVKKLKYTGRIHEQPVNLPPLAHSEISFIHYGYDSDDYELMNYKFERNTKLLKEELKTAKGDNKIYVLFQLSKSYSMAQKKDECYRYIKMAYDLESSRKDNFMHTYVYHWYASVLFNRKEYEKTIKVCKEMLEYADKNLDIYYMMAISYSLLEEYSKAYKYYDEYFKLKEARDNGEYNEDLSLSEGSAASYDKMISNKIICYSKEKKYDKVIEEFEKYECAHNWKAIRDLYVYACIMTKNFKKIKEYFNDKTIDDVEVGRLVETYKEIYINNLLTNVDEVRDVITCLDESLKIYVDVMNGSLENGDKIDFSTYHDWKKEILEELVLKDVANVELIKNKNNDVIKRYINKICNNYKCIDLLYEYTKNKFLTTNILDLNFVCNIESILLVNKSIKGEKYRLLVLRSLINRNNFRKKVFNKDLLESDQIRSVLDEYDRFLFDIEKEIKEYSNDRLNYLRRMNEILKNNQVYSFVVKVFLKEATDEMISGDMILEKDNLLSAVENFISTNQIQNAREILSELENIFGLDYKIISYKGIVDYIEGNLDEALINLSFGALLKGEDFDSVFNIACVLEKKGRIEDCYAYYEKSKKMCEDESMIEQINDILQGLKKVK